MHRTAIAPLAALALTAFTYHAAAQVRPSVFVDYASYESFLDEKVMKRQFGALFQNLGGGGELSLADLQAITEGTKTAFPADFEHGTVLRREPLENGFSHEVRAYWTNEDYAFVYVMLHQRGDELVVVNVAMHATAGPAMAMF